MCHIMPSSASHSPVLHHFLILLKILFIYFLQREEGREERRKRGRETLTWKTSVGCLCTEPHPRHVPWPGNRVNDLSLCRTQPNQLSHHQSGLLSNSLFFKCIYLLLGGGEGRERNINVQEKYQLVASWTSPIWEPGLQPRHVPWLGIEPATFWAAGWHSVHWAKPARVFFIIL